MSDRKRRVRTGARERRNGRRRSEVKRVYVHPGFLRYSEGSVLIEMAETRLVCQRSARAVSRA